MTTDKLEHGQAAPNGFDQWSAPRNGAASGVAPRREPAGPVGRRRSARLLRHPLAAIAAMTVVGALLLGGAALAYTGTLARTYTSESLVIVLTESANSGGDVSPITAAWVEIAHAPTVLDQAASALGIAPAQLTGALTVRQPSSTPLISIRMTTTDPNVSATWANAVAQQLLDQAAGQPIAGFRLDQVTRAAPAPDADPSRAPLILTAGALVGALAGGVLGRAILLRRTRYPSVPMSA